MSFRESIGCPSLSVLEYDVRGANYGQRGRIVENLLQFSEPRHKFSNQN